MRDSIWIVAKKDDAKPAGGFGGFSMGGGIF